MALPLIPLAARAALSLARNKKMRDALTASVSRATKAFKKPKTADITKATKTKSQRAATGFPGGLAVGAGASTVIMDRKLQKKKKKTESSKSKFNKKMEAGQRKSNLQRKPRK